MGIPVLIIGQSGTGKSTSMRNMNPDNTGIIAAIEKPMPFKSNLKKPFITDDYKTIMEMLPRVKAKNIILDDVQYLMANEYMRRAKETGFSKFTEIGLNFWNLINKVVKDLPEDKIVFFLGHSEELDGLTKFKTIGKMLDEKITIEGMFSIVLRTHIENKHYYFTTQNDGYDTVKSPMGMFEKQLIENDLSIVETAIREYYNIQIQKEGTNARKLV